MIVPSPLYDDLWYNVTLVDRNFRTYAKFYRCNEEGKSKAHHPPEYSVEITAESFDSYVGNYSASDIINDVRTAIRAWERSQQGKKWLESVKDSNVTEYLPPKSPTKKESKKYTLPAILVTIICVAFFFWVFYEGSPTNKASPPKEVVTLNGPAIVRVAIVELNPPKHVYVTIKNLSNGLIYSSLYVSKHCNNHLSIRPGDEYNLSALLYESSTKGRYYRFPNLYSELCGSN